MITSQTNLTKLDPCWGLFLISCIYSVQLTDWQQRKRERTCVWGVRSGIHSIFGTASQGLPTTWGYSSLRRCVSESWPPASPRTCVAKAGRRWNRKIGRSMDFWALRLSIHIISSGMTVLPIDFHTLELEFGIGREINLLSFAPLLMRRILFFFFFLPYI